jgi:hypothetical protein
MAEQPADKQTDSCGFETAWRSVQSALVPRQGAPS